MNPLIQELQKAFPGWQARPVEEALNDTLLVLRSNLAGYYARTGEPAPTRENLLEDCGALPPGRSLADKTFLLLYRQGKPAAVLDFVAGYPTPETGYIGLLILDSALQGQGSGQELLTALKDWAHSNGFIRLELGCYETNNPGLAFWRKMGFAEIRRTFRKGADGKERALLSLAKSLDKNF